MFEKAQFPFDAEAMAKLFNAADFTKMMKDAKLPQIDTDALLAAQAANMEAFMEANKAAAAGYQDMFRQQVSLFEGAMEEAKKALSEFDASKMTPEAAQAQQDVMKGAYEKAIAHMTELTTTAQKANKEAYEIVAARMKASIAELTELAKAGK
ncbi:MAG: phasin family protein [Pseudomonadota bacterium]